MNKQMNKAEAAPAKEDRNYMDCDERCCVCGDMTGLACPDCDGITPLCADCDCPNTHGKGEASPAKVAPHTPGPWQSWQLGFSGGQWAFGPHGKCPIGKTLGDNAPVEQANARLIAAAPELLEALQSCFDMLISPKFSGWIDANCADDELWAMTQAMIQRRDQARAAIAKAEGRRS